MATGVKEGNRTAWTVGGVPEGMDALVLAQLVNEAGADKPPGALLHIARDDRRIEALEQGLSFFAPDVRVISFPAWDTVPYDRVGPTSDIVARRMATLAKLSLDSTIQRDIPSRIQASAFARSDTTLQLAWVIGGFVGIAMPLMPQLGLGIAAGVLGLWAAFVLLSRSGRAARPART